MMACTKNTNITVLISHLDPTNQPRIELKLPLITNGDVVGYDLAALVKIAMTVYRLDPDFGVTVDYWANSMQTFIVCGDDFVYRVSRPHRAFGVGGSNTPYYIIPEEDLMFSRRDGKAKLFLRFKNCTGNVIDLSNNDIPQQFGHSPCQTFECGCQITILEGYNYSLSTV